MIRHGAKVLGTFIDALDWTTTLDLISGWADRRESRCVFCCNAHSVVTAYREPNFGEVLGVADMAVPDGAPVAWMLRQTGFPQQTRISGPDLMWKCCADATHQGRKVFLLGSTTDTLDRLQNRLARAFPQLVVAGAFAPPFRPFTSDEDSEIVARINLSAANLVFVGMGCPRQEQWIAAHRGKINAVMIGVGAAFDFHGDTTPRAPVWIRNAGLEWLYRLGTEPRRLWKRYLVTNTLFVLGAVRQLICSGRNSRR